MIDGADTILNKIQADHGIKLSFLKYRCMAVIRDTQDSAEKASHDLKICVYGGDGKFSLLEIPMVNEQQYPLHMISRG